MGEHGLKAVRPTGPRVRVSLAQFVFRRLFIEASRTAVTGPVLILSPFGALDLVAVYEPLEPAAVCSSPVRRRWV
jgi:hypothetical protein